MTDLERIEAAIESLPHVGSINSDNIYLWFHANRKTILEALRFQKAAMGEPSDGMLSAGAKAWIQDPAHKSSTLFKAMIAELSKQVKENKE